MPLAILLLVLLTLPFWWNIQYINAMGLTPKRLIGLACGISAYTLILAYLAWILIPLVRALPASSRSNAA